MLMRSMWAQVDGSPSLEVRLHAEAPAWQEMLPNFAICRPVRQVEEPGAVHQAVPIGFIPPEPYEIHLENT